MSDWTTVKALAAAEGVTPRQIHAWVEKGAVEKAQLARQTGVRVRLRPGATEDDDAAD